MKTLLSALAAIAQGLALAILKWWEGRRTQREAANAEALRGQVESVGRAQDLEARVRAHVSEARVPAPPRPGERRISPNGDVEEWTGTAWAPVEDDFFGDEDYR